MHLCLQFSVRAVDDRPTGVQRTSDAQVTISVLRDSGPPTFVNTPYVTSVPINQRVNTTFYSVRAVDSDLKVIFLTCSKVNSKAVT